MFTVPEMAVVLLERGTQDMQHNTGRLATLVEVELIRLEQAPDTTGETVEDAPGWGVWDVPEWGVWGELTPGERRALKRKNPNSTLI